MGLDRGVAQRVVDDQGRGHPALVAETLQGAGNQRVQPAADQREGGPDLKGGELADDGDNALHGLVGVGGVFPHGGGLVRAGLQELEIAERDAKQVVQVVRDALGDGADGGGATGLDQTALEVEHLAVDGGKTELVPDPRQGFVQVEGLGDVVHRAGPQPLELARLGAAGGDEDDRDVARGLARPAAADRPRCRQCRAS